MITAIQLSETKHIKRSDAPFGLSLAAGVLILLGGISVWLLHSFYPQMGTMMGGFGFAYAQGSAIFGVVSGAVILFGAVMMYYKPAEGRIWGILVLTMSAISLLGMGGFWIGAILGIIGGALALKQ